MRKLSRTVSLATVLLLSVGLLATPAQEEFLVVRGTGYEGAIVPSSSLYHGLHKVGLPPGVTSSGAWTPSPADIAALENAFTLQLTVGTLDLPPSSGAKVAPLILGSGWLRQNVQTLTRQYFGFQLGTTRHVLVHAFATSFSVYKDSWRSEPNMMMDGGCGNLWFDFDVDAGRIDWVRCAGTA